MRRKRPFDFQPILTIGGIILILVLTYVAGYKYEEHKVRSQPQHAAGVSYQGE